MTYTGNGRYDVRIEEDVRPGRQMNTLKIFNITRDKDGVFVFAVPPMKDKDRDQLRSLGIKVDGKAEVFLPDNAKVLEHNASGTWSVVEVPLVEDRRGRRPAEDQIHAGAVGITGRSGAPRGRSSARRCLHPA